MLMEVSDDSGFLALVDPVAYVGYVGRDWDLSRLLRVFADQMRKRHLLVWCTGSEGSWNVELTLGAAPAPGKRELNGGIVCSSGQLLVTNYETLTMAAQFADVRLPEPHQMHQLVAVPAGSYAVRIIQLSESASGGRGERTRDFRVELSTAAELPAPWPRVPWADASLYAGLGAEDL
jgi:hypothetical protein